MALRAPTPAERSLTGRIRILRVIARLNIGGPAFHVSLLSGLLDPDRYETLLVAGRPGPGEGSFESLAARYGARLALLPSLGPQIDPRADLRSLRALAGLVRRFRPDIVHTHTAKAGALGRTAALTAAPRGARPLIVHTYHGHVLEGYFGPAVTAGYRAVERGLGRYSDRLVGVSQATVDDLVRLGIAPRERFEVIPLGLDLERFLAIDPRARSPEERDAVRLLAETRGRGPAASSLARQPGSIDTRASLTRPSSPG